MLLARIDRNSADAPGRDHHTKPKTVPRKWLFRNSGPHTVIGFGDFETVRIHNSTTDKKEYVKANKLSLFNPFGSNVPSSAPLPAMRSRAPPPEPPRHSEPRIGDLCLFHFEECLEEPYGIGELLEYKDTKKWGRYGVYQWLGQHPTTRKKHPNLRTRTWLPQWSDGRLSYWRHKPIHYRDTPVTNESEWIELKPEQLLTWGFSLTKTGRLPPFIIEKITNHQKTQKHNPTSKTPAVATHKRGKRKLNPLWPTR